MKITSSATKIGLRTGWPLVLVLALVLVAFAVKRVIDTHSGVVHEGLFEIRYLEHPIVTALHMLSGILFVCLAPLQFFAKFRTKNIILHKRLGRLLVGCALVSGAYGMISIVVLPAFGGLPTETAGWFFGPIFVYSVSRAFWCARRKNIIAHREWMIRAFALGLAVGTQRIILPLLIIISSDNVALSFEQSFGPALWLGFGINLLVAETWINVTRNK